MLNLFFSLSLSPYFPLFCFFLKISSDKLVTASRYRANELYVKQLCNRVHSIIYIFLSFSRSMKLQILITFHVEVFNSIPTWSTKPINPRHSKGSESKAFAFLCVQIINEKNWVNSPCRCTAVFRPSSIHIPFVVSVSIHEHTRYNSSQQLIFFLAFFVVPENNYVSKDITNTREYKN